MDVVPPVTLQLLGDVEAILGSAGRENLPVLYPGVGYWVEKTTVTWFKFNHFLAVAIADILEHNWYHAWPTYRLIPVHFKTRWFSILARKYTWDPVHTSCVWTQFNLVARMLYRDQMRELKRKWARGGDKPGWLNILVWNNLVDMFEEFGPDNAGFGN